MGSNDLSSFKIGQVSDFPILSHGLPRNTITNEQKKSTIVGKETEEHSALPTEVIST
jgi:hypothetical protein